MEKTYCVTVMSEDTDMKHALSVCYHKDIKKYHFLDHQLLNCNPLTSGIQILTCRDKNIETLV